MGIKKRIAIRKQQKRKRRERRAKLKARGLKPGDFYSSSGVYYEPKSAS